MITFSRLGKLGRLGNQLWQLAGTIGIATSLGDRPNFPSDWAYRKYFSISDSFFTDEVGRESPDFATRLDPRAREYLQDYYLWEDIAPVIRRMFCPSPLAMDQLERDPRFDELMHLPRPIVSVHVRRGDNAAEGPWKAAYHPLRPESYYREGLAHQYRKYSARSVAIFSDDIEWCKRTFADLDPWYFEDGVARPKEHEPEFATAPVLDWIDFFVMCFCDHHVISNSTYAWWAAFLSGSPSPVYPAPWYGPALSYINPELMFPITWTRMEHVDQSAILG